MSDDPSMSTVTVTSSSSVVTVTGSAPVPAAETVTVRSSCSSASSVTDSLRICSSLALTRTSCVSSRSPSFLTVQVTVTSSPMAAVSGASAATVNVAGSGSLPKQPASATASTAPADRSARRRVWCIAGENAGQPDNSFQPYVLDRDRRRAPVPRDGLPGGVHTVPGMQRLNASTAKKTQ